MRTKTNVQAGGHNLNQSETLVRATAQSLKVRTRVRAGKRTV
jgi:hypothetical protein